MSRVLIFFLVIGTLGLAVGYSSLAGIAASVFLLLPAMIYRMHVEDQLLAGRFGGQFTAYAQKTRRLIPGIW